MVRHPDGQFRHHWISQRNGCDASGQSLGEKIDVVGAGDSEHASPPYQSVLIRGGPDLSECLLRIEETRPVQARAS